MSSLYRLILIVNLITLRNHLGMVEQVKVLATKPGDLSLISGPCDGNKELATQDGPLALYMCCSMGICTHTINK